MSRDWVSCTSGLMEKVIWSITPGKGKVQQQCITNTTCSKRWLWPLLLRGIKPVGTPWKENFLSCCLPPPRFTVKPPAKVVAWVGGSLFLNCSATGDPQPVISWKKQGGQLSVGRSQQINGSLVIRGLTLNDKGNYICVAPYAGAFKAETGTYTEVHKGTFLNL